MADLKKYLKLPKKNYKQGDLPDTKEGWSDYIEDLHDHGLVMRKKHEFQWTINLAYYLGYQHLLFNPRTGLLELPREMEQPLIINRIGSFIDSRQAKLTKNRPQTRVIPDTNDVPDTRAAKYSDDVLTHLWRKLEMETEYDKLNMLMLIMGNAFMVNIWDPLAGEHVEVNKTNSDNELFLDEEGLVEKEKIFMGEISSRHKSCFAVIPGNENITNMKDQPWMMMREHRAVSECEDVWPHLRGKLQKMGDDDSLRTEYEKIANRLASPLFTSTGTVHSQKSDSLNSEVLCKYFWMRPNAQYEKGLFIVKVGKEIAYIGSFPNDYGDNIYPIVRFTEKEDGLHFWSQATLEKLIPVQRAFNILREQKLKNAVTMGNAKWLLAKGSGVSEEAINDEEAEIIEYNSALPEPHPAQIAPLPNYLAELAQNLIIDFRDVGGQRESSVSPPPNLTAAVALQVSAEQSDEIIGPILRRMARSMSTVATQQLLLVSQEWIEARKIKVIGLDGRMGAQWLSAADLRNQTDVHIEIESMFPDFRGAKLERLFNLWDRRIIDDPAKMMKALRFGNFDMLYEDVEKAEETVFLDIQMMKKGKEPQIFQAQNHVLYMKELSKFMGTPEFLRLIPERKQLFNAVLQAHTQLFMASLPNQGQAMPQTNQAAVGTPAGPQVPVGAG